MEHHHHQVGRWTAKHLSTTTTKDRSHKIYRFFFAVVFVVACNNHFNVNLIIQNEYDVDEYGWRIAAAEAKNTTISTVFR